MTTIKTTITFAVVIGAIAITSFAFSGVLAEIGVLPGPEKIESTEATRNTSSLSVAESDLAVTILKNDPTAQQYLNSGKWSIMLSGPWVENSETRGAAMLIKFDKSFWTEGDYHDPTTARIYSSSQWIGAMEAFVDLKNEELVSIIPVGLSRAPDQESASDVSVSSKAISGISTASSHDSVNSLSNARTEVLGVITDQNYPDGLAVYRFIGDNSDESLVTVNLSDMTIMEENSGRVGLQ